MFTGIIRHIGKVTRRVDRAISIDCPTLVGDIAVGDSISVSGACLTASRVGKSGFDADLLPETAKNTILGSLKPGDTVNLEVALAAKDRFGGHFVQGHVDGTTVCTGVERRSDGTWLVEFSAPDWLRPWLIEKGSIAVDGISLTLQDTAADGFAVSIIPTTLKDTTLGNIIRGSRVNIEADMVVKTVRSAVDSILGQQQSLDADTLKNYGYGK